MLRLTPLPRPAITMPFEQERGIRALVALLAAENDPQKRCKLVEELERLLKLEGVPPRKQDPESRSRSNFDRR